MARERKEVWERENERGRSKAKQTDQNNKGPRDGETERNRLRKEECE